MKTNTKTGTSTRKKTALKVIVIILIVILVTLMICISVTLIGNSSNMKMAKKLAAVSLDDPLTPVKDAETGYWTFTTDRDFRILHLTDIHIGGGFMSLNKDSKAIKAVADLVTYTKPDLVVITGDMVYPVPFQAGTFNNMSSTKIFVQTMESLGVYWTVTFGNHDTEAYSYYDRKQISDYYAKDEWKYCLYEAGLDEIDGYGNSFINVENSAGLITQSIITIDSHAYKKGFYQDYDNIHENQIAWYEKEIKALDAINRANGATSTFQSLAFFHIPLEEHRTAWFEYADNGNKDTVNSKLIYGTAGETGKVVYCGTGEDEMFETMQRLGSTQGVFTGHDHYNNFSIEYTTEGYEDRPIRLTYGFSIDYLAYFGIGKKTDQRGGTVITVSPDGKMDCYGLLLQGHVVVK